MVDADTEVFLQSPIGPAVRRANKRRVKTISPSHESLRDRLEQVFSQTNERTRSRFTREDGDKLGLRLREIEHQHVAFERQMVERLTSVQIKVIALETRDTSAHEIAMLRAEVDRLHTFIVNRPTGVLASYPNTVSSNANGGPVHLPPTIRR